MKKESWFHAFICACCGLVLCLLAGAVYTWVGIWVEKAYNNGQLVHEIMINSIRRLIGYLVINILLITTGMLAIRFREGIKQLKGRWAVMVILLLIESPIIARITPVIRTMYVLGSVDGWLRHGVNIAIIVGIGISAFIGLYSRTYKIRTYLTGVILAIVLSIVGAVCMVRGIYSGFYTLYDIVSIQLILQPFAVLFPIISLLKALIVPQNNTDNDRQQKDILEGHCPYCGAKIEAGMLFCKECGSKI